MAKEIERKYSVNDLSVIEGRIGSRIFQGYIAETPMKVRVRIIEAEAFMTLKSRTVGIVRDEFEFPLPMHQAIELMERYCGQRIIEKTRYRIRHGVHTFEVDVFGGRHEGLVIAEVELDHAEQEVDLPYWIGTELTGDKRFSNHWLSHFDEAPRSASTEAPTSAKVSMERERGLRRRKRTRHGTR